MGKQNKKGITIDTVLKSTNTCYEPGNHLINIAIERLICSIPSQSTIPFLIKKIFLFTLYSHAIFYLHGVSINGDRNSIVMVYGANKIY